MAPGSMLAFICASFERPRQCWISAFVRVLRAIGLVLAQESNKREAVQLPRKEAIFTMVTEENEGSQLFVGFMANESSPFTSGGNSRPFHD
jgi:hypothetical protein